MRQIRPAVAAGVIGGLLIVLGTVAAVGLVVLGWETDVDRTILVGTAFGVFLEFLVGGLVLFLLADIRDAVWLLAANEKERLEEDRLGPASEDTAEWPWPGEHVPAH